MQHNRTTGSLLDISWQDIISLFKRLKDPERKTRKVLYIIGTLLFPLTVIGAIWGYIRAYNRHLKPKDELPWLYPLKPISKLAMIIFGILIWVILIAVVNYGPHVYMLIFGSRPDRWMPYIILGVNFVLTAIALWLFKRWQNNVFYMMQEHNRFGSARWAKASDLADLVRQAGVYIGNKILAYKKQGHILTVAGTRTGKFVNLIAQNLLGLSGYSGSIFMTDVKGEAASVSARFRRMIGTVLILNPWNVLNLESCCYNPLDLLSGQANPDHLVDDIAIIAEMLVPKEITKDPYWDNRARTLISGLILHLVTSKPKEEHSLGMIWQWLRLPEEEFHDLLGDMSISENEIVRATANEFISLMTTSDKAFGSVMSTACDKTDFLKSPALRKSMQSSTFDINTLSNGKTTLYVVIPPDKLDSHSQWLRLVFATALRAVIRNKNKRTLFILDECAALGYLPEIKTALSTYAGYNVSMWPIFQDLSQIRSLYGEAWETFIANTAVRHYFGVNDNFTASYLEKAFGVKTVVTYEASSNGTTPKGTSRPLATADEIMRGSAENIFCCIEQRPPTYFPKAPYYEMPTLQGLYDPNPYYKPETDENS